jgi:hypothetical protein
LSWRSPTCCSAAAHRASEPRSPHVERDARFPRPSASGKLQDWKMKLMCGGAAASPRSPVVE